LTNDCRLKTIDYFVVADLDDFAANADIKCTVKVKNVKKFAKTG